MINFFIQEYKIMRATFVKGRFLFSTIVLNFWRLHEIRNMKLTEKVIFDRWLKLYMGLNAEDGVQISNGIYIY